MRYYKYFFKNKNKTIMKKITTLFAALLLTASSFACHPSAIGNCAGEGYFKLISFYAGYQFEYTFNGKDSVINTVDSSGPIFSVPQADVSKQVTIVWRFKKNVGGWSAWDSTKTLWAYDSAICFKVTPVSLSNLTGTLKDNILTVSFVAGAKSVDHYNIQVSNDAINWQTVATEANAGTFTINLAGKAIAGIGLLGLGFIGFKKKRIIWLAMASLCCIFYVSCQKEIVKPDNQVSYKYMRVQEVGTDGGIQNSNIIKL